MHLSPELRLWCMKKKKKSRRFDLSVAPFSAFSALMQATIHIPQHIAIVMDGNGRWAIQKGLPRIAGHRKGVEVVRDIARACAERGIAYLTLFAFSSENWRRPKEEVAFLMRLFTNALEREIGQLHENGIRLRVIGDLTQFEPSLQRQIQRAEAKTAHKTRMTLTVAANYGGRWDILQAARRCASNALNAGRPISLSALNEADIAKYLAIAYAPEPDLLIRTGGEQRISNFLLWQLAYTELYFTDTFWPDFNAEAFAHALHWYRSRERRFGSISAQREAPAYSAKAV